MSVHPSSKKTSPIMTSQIDSPYPDAEEPPMEAWLVASEDHELVGELRALSQAGLSPLILAGSLARHELRYALTPSARGALLEALSRGELPAQDAQRAWARALPREASLRIDAYTCELASALLDELLVHPQPSLTQWAQLCQRRDDVESLRALTHHLSPLESEPLLRSLDARAEAMLPAILALLEPPAPAPGVRLERAMVQYADAWWVQIWSEAHAMFA